MYSGISTWRWLAVPFLLCTCDAAQSPAYEGEPLAVFGGRVVDQSTRDVAREEILVAWISEGHWLTHQGRLDGTVDWELEIFPPPPSEALLGWGAVRLSASLVVGEDSEGVETLSEAFEGLAFGWLVLMPEGFTDQAGADVVQWEDEEAIQAGAAQVIGGVEEALLVYAAREFSKDSWPARLLGEEIAPGYHILTASPPDPEAYAPCLEMDDWEARVGCAFDIRSRDLTLSALDETLTLKVVDAFEDLGLPLLI